MQFLRHPLLGVALWCFLLAVSAAFVLLKLAHVLCCYSSWGTGIGNKRRRLIWILCLFYGVWSWLRLNAGQMAGCVCVWPTVCTPLVQVFDLITSGLDAIESVGRFVYAPARPDYSWSNWPVWPRWLGDLMFICILGGFGFRSCPVRLGQLWLCVCLMCQIPPHQFDIPWLGVGWIFILFSCIFLFRALRPAPNDFFAC